MGHQALQDRQSEARSFARACLGGTHNVFALQDDGDGLGLDRGWNAITHLSNSAVNRVGKSEI
jgi:hypothetical protein